MQVLVREKRHAGTKDSCDIDAVIAAQMQFSKAHPVDLILGNQNVAGDQRRMRRRKINVGFLLPEKSNDGSLRLGSRHYSQLVTHKYLRVRTRTRDHAVVQNARADESSSDEVTDVAHRLTVDAGIRNSNMKEDRSIAVCTRLFVPMPIFLFKIDAKHLS